MDPGQCFSHFRDDSYWLSGLSVLTQLVDSLGVVFGIEDGGTGNESVGTGSGDPGDVVDLHPAIDFQADIAAAAINHLANNPQFLKCMGDKGLPAETGIYRHHQNQVELIKNPVEDIRLGRGIQNQACFATFLPDQVDGAVDMATGFRVKADDAGTCFCEIRYQAVDRFNHQMNVNWRGDAVFPQRLAHQWPDGEIWYIVIIHHIKMNPIRSSGQDRFDFFPKTGEIC